jgi:hypothetical protein
MRKHCAQPALPHHRKTYRSGIRGHRASPEREQEVAVVVFDTDLFGEEQASGKKKRRHLIDDTRDHNLI